LRDYEFLVSARFEELDYRETSMGELILRRRIMPELGGIEVHEVILGDAFLMSSLFTVVERALSELGLAAVEDSGQGLDVVVGGLGLGYTAKAALDHPGLRSLLVVDFLQPVIEWHEKGLVPLGPAICGDPRTRLVHGSFFDLARTGFDPLCPGRKFDAVLLDIDHSPTNLLDETHRDFYSVEGLGRMSAQLKPGGVFALWSDDPPDEFFMAALRAVFPTCVSHVVPFPNPHQGTDSASTVYVAK
jgi:spermidine synthase